MKMMPSIVSDYMIKNVKEQMAPLCLSFDEQLALVNWVGEIAAYQFPELKAGMMADRLVPVMHGVDASELPLRFPMVEVFHGAIAHVHLIQGENGLLHVLMFDASKDHKQRQVYQQKANEVQLLNEQLNKVLKELEHTQEELKKKRQEAEEASELKSQFIANMSHEFRTPLTSIIGYTEMWQKGLLQPQQVRSAVESVSGGAKHLLSLIENILDQARFEAGEMKLDINPVNVVNALTEVANMFKPIANKKNLQFNLDLALLDKGWYALDAMRLKQVVINLCNNAIKFTHQGSVMLKAAMVDGYLNIDVMDTGIGIDKTQQEAIFDPFRRAENTEHTEGAGLGLAITQQILDLMGGGLSLTSELGEGAVFSVCIPVEPIAQTLHDDEGESNESVSATVLIAEDNDDIVEMVELFLINAGFSVLVAQTGKEALAKIESHSPDLVLMDINMPVLDGVLATQKAREQGYAKPILVLSAASSEQDRERAMNAGCNDFLLKPIAMNALISSVKHHLYT